MPEGTPLLEMNSNWVHVVSFILAGVFALLAVGLNKYKKSPNPINTTTVFYDLLRGASIFPLFLFVMTPLLPNLSKLALTGDPVLLSLGAVNGLFAILDDWWKNI